MKKLLLSLLVAVFMMPIALQAQTNAPRQIIGIDTAACDAFDFEGITYTSDTVLLRNNAANDTLFVYNVTIYESYNQQGDTIVVNCSHTFGETIYSTTGFIHDTATSIHGCDSIASFYLQVLGRDTVEIDTTVCEYFNFNGEHIYNDTVIIDTVEQCIVLNDITLDVITPRFTEVYDTIVTVDSLRCENYHFEGVEYTETTTIDTVLEFRTLNTCLDSSLHLFLEIYPSYETTEEVEACASYTVGENTYNYSFQEKEVSLGKTIHGCDSTTILSLTIKPAPVIESIDGDLLVVPGASATIYATMGLTNNADVASAEFGYKWEYDGQTITTDTLSIASVANNTDILLTVTNRNNQCDTTRWITIIATDTPIGFENLSESTVVLFPNPAVDHINIESSEAIRNITIYNAIGQKVVTMDGTNRIDVSNFDKGMYSIRIIMENGNTTDHKFIIAR